MPAFYWNPTAPRDKKPATLSPKVPYFRVVQSTSARLPAAPASNQWRNPASPAAPVTHRFVVSFGKFLQWGRGAVGSAPRWHRGGRGFESHRLHQNFVGPARRHGLQNVPATWVTLLGRRSLPVVGGRRAHCPWRSLFSLGQGFRSGPEKRGGSFPLRIYGSKPLSQSPSGSQAHCFKPLRILLPCDPSHILSPCGNLILR